MVRRTHSRFSRFIRSDASIDRGVQARFTRTNKPSR
jgi:hypothetical protein